MKAQARIDRSEMVPDEEETKSARKPPMDKPPPAKAKGKPMSGAKGRPRAEEVQGDTFLTDMLFKRKTPSKPNLKPSSQQSKQKAAQRDDQSDDDLSEYRDMVFDIDESKALV